MKNFGILGKLVTFISITLIISFGLIYIIFKMSFDSYSQFMMENTDTLLMSRYKTELKSATDVAVALIAAINNMEGLSERQKMDLSRKLVRKLNFGTDGYYFVYQKGTGKNLIHGSTPELEGKSLWNLQSPDRKSYIIRDLDKTARENKIFYQYAWSKPGVKGLHEKLGTAVAIPGTNMWVGTGSYLDEINAGKKAVTDKVRKITFTTNLRIIASFIILTILSLVVIILIAKNLTGPIKKLIASARQISEGNYEVEFTAISRDEVGVLALTFTDMAHRVRDLTENLEHKVEDRTKELQETLEKLNETNEILEGLSEKLSRYLSPQLRDQIFTGKQDVTIASSRKKLTVFFSDIKNFTQTTERMETESLTDLLNTYLDEMSQVALKHGATIDKFIGDAILVFFGDPESRGDHQDALSAVSMALEMRKRLAVLQKKWFEEGIAEPFHVRMGINTGYCTVGNFGSNDRMEYTIIGGQVNLASRLESSAEPNNILISHETYSLVKEDIYCVEGETILVKGISYPVRTYKVIDFHDSLQKEGRLLEEQMEGFSVSMDFSVLSEDKKEKIYTILNDVIVKLQSDNSCPDFEGSTSISDINSLFNESNEAIDEIAASRNITITKYVNDDCLFININPQQLRNILNGFIHYAVSNTRDSGEVFINAWKDEAMLKISIADQGELIPKEKIKLLFAADSNGESLQGASLYDAKGMVKELNGTIAVKSSSGRGNNFIISLPV